MHAPQCSLQHYLLEARHATFFFFYSKNRRNKKNKNSVKQAVSKDAVKLHGICKSKSFNISKQSKSHISEPSYMLKFK